MHHFSRHFSDKCPFTEFDPDDIFKDPRAITPLGLGPDENLLNSDSDSMDDPMHPKQAVVYAYDAAAEREKEWLKEARAVLPQRVAST